MGSRFLKIAAAVALVTAAAFGGERTLVIVQGKAVRNSARTCSWSVCENGVFSTHRDSETFRVPPGRTLVITEAAFILRGKVNRAVRVGVTMRQGNETFDLAGITARLEAQLGTNFVGKRFSPGLVVPAGSEVRGELSEVEPGGAVPRMDVNFYGFYLP